MSQRCQIRTSSRLFNRLVGAEQNGCRQRHTQRARCLEVCYQLEARRAFDGQIGGCRSVIDNCIEMGLVEVGTVILIKKHDQDVPDNWSLLGDDVIDNLKAKVDVAQFTGLHKKTVNGRQDCG